MKKLIIILLLIPCLVKAQTSTDTIIADTVTRVTILKSGNINFDTIRIANNTIQGFTYDLKGYAPNVFSFAHIVVYVTNNNGVYSLIWPPSAPNSSLPGSLTNYVGVGMLNSFGVIISNNLVIVQYKAAAANKTIMNWVLNKQKINP